MSYKEPLSGHSVAISISESPDMEVFGLASEHLDDAMAEIARHLLAMGARLMYGGDLRPKGFTELLFELVARHRRDADIDDERVGVSNFLAWPVHISMSHEELKRFSEALRGAAELVCLAADGTIMSPDQRDSLAPQSATAEEWTAGLTAMRNVMTSMSDARVVLGGKVDHFKGRMPGVAEEALIALRFGQPLFLLGGFGGCARDIAQDLGLVSTWPMTRVSWPGRSDFASFAISDVNNGLDQKENAILATTPHIDQAVALILRGLLHRKKAERSTS